MSTSPFPVPLPSLFCLVLRETLSRLLGHPLTLGGFAGGCGISNPLTTFVHNHYSKPTRWELKVFIVVEATESPTTGQAVGSVSKKSAGCITRLHLQGAPPARSAAQPSLTAVANLPLETAYLNPFLSSCTNPTV